MAAEGAWGPAPDVGWLSAEDESTDPASQPGDVYLARLPSGPVAVLADTAGAIWRALLGARDLEAILDRLAADGFAREAIPPEQISGFLADLEAGGWITRPAAEPESGENDERGRPDR